jgi:hypothetical protein
MEKEEVLKVLESEGRFKEYDDLYRNDVTLADWVSRNEDLIRSNRNIAKAVGVDAPHGGVSDSYFEGQSIAKDKYEKQEKKLSDSQKEKQKLADEYARAKDIENASKFGWERPTKDMSFSDRAKLAAKNLNNNLIALGLKLTPQAAKNVYIKEGYNPGKLALHGGIGTMANVSELMPGVGPVGKAVTTFAGPAIRAGQDIAEGKDKKEIASNFAHDAGLNTLFSYLPVKEAYNYGKRILGKQGGQGEKAVASTIEKELNKIDALENAKAANEARRAIYTKIDDFERQFDKGILNDTDVLNFADEIESLYPQLAKRLRDHVNLVAKNTVAGVNATVAKEIGNTEKAAKNEAEELITSKKLPESKEAAVNELAEAKKNAYDRYDLGEAIVGEDKNLIRPLPDDNIAEIWRVSNPSKFARTAVEVLPAARGSARVYSGPDRASSAPEDKDYNNAIEYIISNYSRQWDAGFKPRDGIELEAWKKYMGIK